MTGTGETPQPTTLHGAARAEDALNRALARSLYRRGWRPQVLGYSGYGTARWVRVLCRVLLSPPGINQLAEGRKTVQDPVGFNSTRTADRTMRGWRHFISAKLAGVPVTITIGNWRQVVECGRGGYIDVVLPVKLTVPADGGWVTAGLRIAGGPTVQASLRLVGDQERFAVISDIDDTVLVTALPRPFLAFWNTFVRREESRRPAPGMAALYQTLTVHVPDAMVVYVSTGAWNLAPALRRFLRRHSFPDGPMLLTDWGPTPEGWFRSGQDHKRRALRRLMDEFPHLRWVLVGDDGQHDPSLYEELVWARQDRVRLVAIRELGTTDHVLTHGRPMPLDGVIGSTLSGSSVPWVRASTGYGLIKQLADRRMTRDQTLRP